MNLVLFFKDHPKGRQVKIGFGPRLTEKQSKEISNSLDLLLDGHFLISVIIIQAG